jgi:hypothetical protein
MHSLRGASAALGVLPWQEADDIANCWPLVTLGKVAPMQKKPAVPDLKKSVTHRVVPFDNSSGQGFIKANGHGLDLEIAFEQFIPERRRSRQANSLGTADGLLNGGRDCSSAILRNNRNVNFST